MTKRIAAKIEEYQKDGQVKGKYVDIGVILSNEHGEYIMLNPTVDLSGVLMKQRILAQQNGKKSGGSVMCSIFDNDNQGAGNQQQQQQGGFQQPAQQQQNFQQQQQQPQSQQNHQPQGGQPAPSNFDDEIPF